jgi:hypothetical protein
VYKTQNRNRKKIYKNLLHGLAMSCISERKNPTECSFDELQQAEKEPTPRMSK